MYTERAIPYTFHHPQPTVLKKARGVAFENIPFVKY